MSRVKLILEKDISPDNWWHGETGIITRITFDAAGDVTGDGETSDLHFRYDDLVRLEEH